MKLSRMTVQVLTRLINKQRALGIPSGPGPLTDVALRRLAIDAWLLDGQDVMAQIGLDTPQVATRIAQFRNNLRAVSNSV